MDEKKNLPGNVKSKNRNIRIIVATAVIIIAVILCVMVLRSIFGNKDTDAVYVSSVASIAGLEAQSVSKYTGIVDPQETIEIKKDESKTVLEIFVEEGQEVKVGDKLFSYNTDEMNQNLQQAELELESYNQKITTLKKQITELEKEKKAASSDDKVTVTLKIQEAELDIKSQEYEISVKNKEIDDLKSSIENAEVCAEKDGVVKSISENGEFDANGNTLPFMSILTTGDYRIKGTISELNLQSISEGQPVIIHSRVDSAMTWSGTIESIDTENPIQSNSDMYMNGQSSEKSSKYNFYAVLDSFDGLILGQHVYIEPDYGQNEVREGIWIPSYYIVSDESESFVWAANSKDTLEKRTVELGQYDEESDTYEILSGLAENDYLAFPDETLYAGMPTTTEVIMDEIVDEGIGIVDEDGGIVDGGGGIIDGGGDIIDEGGGIVDGGGDIVDEVGDAADEDGNTQMTPPEVAKYNDVGA